MRLFVTRSRIAVAFAAVVATIAWLLPSLQARVAPQTGGFAGGVPTQMAVFGGGGGGAGGTEAPPPRVYFRTPITPEAARVWIKLGQKVPLKFPQETPFEEFLKAIKAATADKEDPGGLQIYVDPVGLSESEKTMATPITIDLDGVRLETGLKLVLGQLDLAFHVHPDGLLIITSRASEDGSGQDATAQILDRLDAIQKQVAELRRASGFPRPGAMMKAQQ